jgi:hypothetical protein
MVNMTQEYWVRRRTFGEESCVAIEEVTPEKPAIAKFIVALNQLNSIAFTETKLIRATSMKVIYVIVSGCEATWTLLGRCGEYVRITIRVSPMSGRGPSLGPLGGGGPDMVDVGSGSPKSNLALPECRNQAAMDYIDVGGGNGGM